MPRTGSSNGSRGKSGHLIGASSESRKSGRDPLAPLGPTPAFFGMVKKEGDIGEHKEIHSCHLQCYPTEVLKLSLKSSSSPQNEAQ